MSRLARILVACLALSVLAGCGEDDLQGDVTAKHVDPGFTYVSTIPITTGKTTTFIPMVMYVPPCYELTVEGSVSGETCVDESEWNATEVGDYYEGPDVDPKDREVEKGEAR